MKSFLRWSLIIVVVLAVSIYFGYCINIITKNKSSNIGGEVKLATNSTEEDKSVATSSGENVISPNSSVPSNENGQEEHYILKEYDGCVAIYRMISEDEIVLEDVTDIITKYLTEEDLIDLKDGISVVGIEELTHTLEDFE